MVISFSHPLARAQLLEKGRVYTFRKNRRKKVGNDWANEGRLKPKLCDVYIGEMGQITIGELYFYESESGFENSVEWLKAIEDLNGGPWDLNKRGWLYHVQRRSNGSETE